MSIVVRRVWQEASSRARNATNWLVQEAGQILDMAALRSATDWRGRLEAISWRRAGLAGLSVATIVAVAGLGFWLTRPEFGGHPPRLPTDQEWRASQAADRAMESGLSPALAEANASVTP